MAEKVRTYGNWRAPQSPGIGRLGTVGTILLLGGLVIVAFAMMISVIAGLIATAVIGATLTPLLIKDRNGRTALQAIIARAAWLRGRMLGWNTYRSGPLSLRVVGKHRLPGLLASTRLVEVTDTYGRVFALVVVPSTGHYSVVLECAPDGTDLVDTEQVDTWVAHWGRWLASLGHEPGLAGVSVTVETAPDPGHRLSKEVGSRMRPDAPGIVRQALKEILRSYPTGSAQVTTRIAITYNAAARQGGRRRSQADMAREIGTRLPGLMAGLGMTGAGTVRPMSASQLIRAVRGTYDVSTQSLMEQLPTQAALTWEDAGPTAMQEAWGHLVHDSGVSVTWGLAEAPRGEVLSSVLAGLVAPHPDVAYKRVTLLYRPYDAATAARLVERDRRDARFKVSGNVAARDAIAVAAADQTAREEARGAGLLRFTVLVTATVRSLDALPRAEAAVDSLSAPARIRLRRMWGSQSAAFAASLPLGIILPAHLQVPGIIRELQ